MKEHPILFSTEMVQAIMAGRKIQTRRIVDKKYQEQIFIGGGDGKGHIQKYKSNIDFFPYGYIGSLLWVRETFHLEKYFNGLYEKTLIKYKADYGAEPVAWNWRPSIFLPKERARIWLEITNIRIERLNDISEDDAEAEGVLEYEDGTYRNYYKKKGLRETDGVECLLAKGSFQSLWDSINGKPTRKKPNPPSWESNPWVWAITFKILSTTGKPEVTLPSGSKSLEEKPRYGKDRLGVVK